MDFEQEITEITETVLKKGSVFSVSSCLMERVQRKGF